MNIIGKHIKIIDGSNKQFIGIEGTLVDETKQLLVIEYPKGLKKIPKNHVVLEVDKSIIDGKKLVGRPEERLKK